MAAEDTKKKAPTTYVILELTEGEGGPGSRLVVHQLVEASGAPQARKQAREKIRAARQRKADETRGATTRSVEVGDLIATPHISWRAEGFTDETVVTPVSTGSRDPFAPASTQPPLDEGSSSS